MNEINDELNKLLQQLSEQQNQIDLTVFQEIYLKFRGIVSRASARNRIYKQWVDIYLLDVGDESGEIVKMHESVEELKEDIDAFMNLVKRKQKS